MCYHLIVKTAILGLSLAALYHYATIFYLIKDRKFRIPSTVTQGGITVAFVAIYLSFLFRQRNFELECILSFMGSIMHLATSAIILAWLHSYPKDKIAIQVGLSGIGLGILFFIDFILVLQDKTMIYAETNRLKQITYGE